MSEETSLEEHLFGSDTEDEGTPGDSEVQEEAAPENKTDKRIIDTTKAAESKEEILKDRQRELTKVSQELKTLEADLAKKQAKLEMLDEKGTLSEDEVYDSVVNSMDEDDQDLQYTDPKAFTKKYNAAKAKYLKDKSSPTEELKTDIAKTEQEVKAKQVIIDYQKSHPDFDIDSVEEFFKEDLPPRKAKEFNSIAKDKGETEALDFLFGLYREAKGITGKKGKPVLPDVSSARGVSANNMDDTDSDFDSLIGFA